MGTVFLLLFYYLPLFLILYIITKHYFVHKIRKLPPSPFPSLPIFGHLHLLKRPLHRTLSELSNKHGPLIYLQLGSRPTIIASSPSIAEECLRKNDVIFANRPRLAVGKYLGYNNTILTRAPYGDHWRNLRRIVTIQLLSANRLLTMADIRLNEVKSLLRRLFRYGNQTVDMRTALFELTFNSIMMMIAGRRYYGENVTDAEEAKSFRKSHAESIQLTAETNIEDYLSWVRSNRKLTERLKECGRKRDEFAQRLLEDERRKKQSDCSNQGNKTMIQFLLSMREKEPEYYTDDVIKGIMLVLLSAGTGTTIDTMEWAMSHLVNHHEVFHKAQAEIDKCIGNDRLIDETDLSRLPYLRGIISETMRMHPVVPLLLPHESSEECVVGGYKIPEGATLLVNAWAIQNDPKNWEDPTKFRPERFQALKAPREDFKLMPFGYGRRSCPGEGLALLMMGLALGSLIQCFEWDAVGDQMVDMTEGLGVTLARRQPLELICRPRPNMVKLLSQI